MGIELPTPSVNNGEARVAPQSNENRPSVAYGAERPVAQSNVESLTTQRPSAQEVRTGQGVGDAFSSSPQSDVTSTSNDATQAVAQPAVSLDDVPVVAADEDLIEKQWVDSTKQIIKDTRTDPYRQSEAISRLQADYLQKRYGKTVSDGGA